MAYISVTLLHVIVPESSTPFLLLETQVNDLISETMGIHVFPSTTWWDQVRPLLVQVTNTMKWNLLIRVWRGSCFALDIFNNLSNLALIFHGLDSSYKWIDHSTGMNTFETVTDFTFILQIISSTALLIWFISFFIFCCCSIKAWKTASQNHWSQHIINIVLFTQRASFCNFSFLFLLIL